MATATNTRRRGEGAPIQDRHALTLNDAGEPVIPETAADWLDWVAATKTRNHAIGDPLLDWLDLYGTVKGFQGDDELLGYDERCDFTRFVFRQAERFEEVVVEHLRGRVQAIAFEHLYSRFGPVVVDPGPSLITIARTPADIRSLDRALETVEAMRAGAQELDVGSCTTLL